jgi:hypothetical protein
MRAAPVLLVVAFLTLARSAMAQTAPNDHPSLVDRPHTVLDLEAGIIALPTAAISASNRGGNVPFGTVGSGDATVQTGIHILYRATREWAVGAGALFAPRPTTDPNYYGGLSGIPRSHSRSYLTMGAEGRWYPLRTRWFEGWVGATAGGVIISDRFTNDAATAVPSILGTSEITVSTEGFAMGLQTGAEYLVTDSWVIGLALRGDWWVLPTQQNFFTGQTTCDAIGDCPTLTGNVFAFELGLTVGYRIPL